MEHNAKPPFPPPASASAEAIHGSFPTAVHPLKYIAKTLRSPSLRMAAAAWILLMMVDYVDFAPVLVDRYVLSKQSLLSDVCSGDQDYGGGEGVP